MNPSLEFRFPYTSRAEEKPAQPGAAHTGVPPFTRLRRILATERNQLWIALIYSLAIGLLTLVVPIATQSLVNTIAFGNLLQPLVILTLVVVAGLGVSTIFQSMRVYLVEIIQRRVFVRVASESVGRLLRVRGDAFDSHHGPELVNRFFDVVTVQKSAAMLLIEGLSVAMQTVIGMLLLAVYHPWLLAFDLLLVAAILFVLFPLGAGAVPTAIRESKAKYELVAWLEEIARHTVTFKSEAGARFAFDRTDQLVASYLGYRGKHFRIVLRQILGSLGLQALASASLLGVGGWLVMQRQLTLGQLVASELVVALVVSGFSKFGKHLEVFYDLLAAIDKLGHIQDLPSESSGKETLPPASQGAGVVFRQVVFGYAGAQPVLNGANFVAEPGTRTGIVAHSGSGKSTALNLIYGLLQPQGGAIEIDGFDLRHLSKADLRSQVLLLRHSEIFHGSILDNVRLGAQEKNHAEVREALEQAGILEDILRLPGGLDCELATGGLPLSAGQTVQLMFARAFLMRPRLLIVDELMDQLHDARERDTILNRLFAPNPTWTLLIASADATILEGCDRVWEIHDGLLTAGVKQ